MAEFLLNNVFVLSRVFGKLCPKMCFCVHVSLKRLANDRFGMKKVKSIEILGVGGQKCIDFSC